jgi:hypothetical protein
MIVRTFALKLLGLGCIIGGHVGCIGGCEAPPPAVERVPVAAPGNRTDRIDYDTPKPLPENARLYDRDHEYAPPKTSTDKPSEPK